MCFWRSCFFSAPRLLTVSMHCSSAFSSPVSNCTLVLPPGAALCTCDERRDCAHSCHDACTFCHVSCWHQTESSLRAVHCAVYRSSLRRRVLHKPHQHRGLLIDSVVSLVLELLMPRCEWLFLSRDIVLSFCWLATRFVGSCALSVFVVSAWNTSILCVCLANFSNFSMFSCCCFCLHGSRRSYCLRRDLDPYCF